MRKDDSSRLKRRPYVMAMVLGTALSALGPASGQAAQEIPDKAVNDISRYCTACWRNARLPMDRWGDCTQEVFRRLLERVEPGSWSELLSQDGNDRREFFRAIDAVRKRTQRERSKTVALPSVVDDSRDGTARSEERHTVEQAAEELLNQRQRQILQMSLDGWSVQDMAAALSLPAERISDEKYKAIRKLRQHFAGYEASHSSAV